MYQPQDHLFHPVNGLELAGILGDHVHVSTYNIGDGIVWMRALLMTRDLETNRPGEISFKTPYPAELPEAWIISDFIAWVVSHEMMECVRRFGRPVYNVDRLVSDHASYPDDVPSFVRRMNRVRQRFNDDRASGRWGSDFTGLEMLSKSLGLGPAFR
jgi:hypothetical protein